MMSRAESIKSISNVRVDFDHSQLKKKDLESSPRLNQPDPDTDRVNMASPNAGKAPNSATKMIKNGGCQCTVS